MVDGVSIKLSDIEQTEKAAHEAAWTAKQAEINKKPNQPDLATQLASILIAKGAIEAKDLNAETLAGINDKMALAGTQEKLVNE